MIALGCLVEDLAYPGTHHMRGNEDPAGAALAQAAGEDVVVPGQDIQALDRPHLAVVGLLEAGDVLKLLSQRSHEFRRHVDD